MAPTVLEKTISDRDSVRDMIDYVHTEIETDATTPLEEAIIDNLLQQIKAAQTELFEVHKKIAQLVTAQDMVPHQAAFKQHSARANRALNALVKLKSKFSLNNPANSSNSTTSDLRLPRLELPTFDGNMHEWVSFRDMFINAIHENKQISKAQKLTYLKAQLRGEAARQVQSIVISDANYTTAWDLLKERYQNDRQILFSTLNRLVNQPQVTIASSTSIRQLIDISRECISSLRILQQPVDQWDAILLFHMQQKLDPVSKELYEQGLKDSSIPQLKSLFDFMEQRARALEASGSSQKSTVKQANNAASNTQRSKVIHISTNSCKACSDSTHPIHKCPKFEELRVQDRIELVKKQRLCFNCLRDNHAVSHCNSQSSCHTCKRRHHTLLHVTNETKGSSGSEKQLILNHHARTTHNNQTILATAQILVKDSFGRKHLLRVLLDSGADTHIISSKSVKRIGLSWRKSTVLVTGLSSTPVGTARGILDLKFSPHFDETNTYIAKGVLIMPTVTSKLPIYPCNPNLSHLREIQLADEDWHCPKDIDMIIGASLFYCILEGKKRRGKIGEPFALSSELGWLVAGEIHSNKHKDSVCINHIQKHTSTTISIEDIDLNNTLQQFWEIESIEEEKKLTIEEQACEDNFQKTYTQLSDGRFMVKLPFKTHPPPLGKSRDIAIQRLKAIERRLDRHPQYKDEYKSFMYEYLQCGHMQMIPDNEINADNTCYIPHHFVLKESSSTTKLRVVFDASAKTTNSNSLNSSLMVGPTIQDNLIDIMIRFRTHPIAFTADIEKMYRQIRVSDADTNYQRIVWREDTFQPIKDYKLLTVTYGTSPAPYLATRVLQQLAINERKDLPVAAEIALNDFYVDDVMSGKNTVKAALEAQAQIIQLVQRGGMTIRKWTSNHHSLINSLPLELRETKSILPMDTDMTVKTLGIYWKPTSDVFIFKIDKGTSITNNRALTKRVILSEIAKIFDPIGWLAPVVINAKLQMQRLWTLKNDWDDELPATIQEEWNTFKSDLMQLEQLQIPRCIKPNYFNSKLALVGFSDSSEKAYAAVIYLCVYPNDDLPPLISLITSKTRVAPTKTISLPRLELCGALLLANLLHSVKQALKLTFDHISAWSDSTVTLAWIKAHPSRWTTFVANRVTEIQAKIHPDLWGHVAGQENPADCASRGLESEALIKHKLWWNGPDWLRRGIPTLRVPEEEDHEDIKKEMKKQKICMVTQCNSNIMKNKCPFELIQRFSTLNKLQRVTAWILRFYNNCKIKINLKIQEDLSIQQHISPLSPSELKNALLHLIKYTQKQEFKGEIKSLKKHCKVEKSSKIISLNPFLDNNGILRVGGRLTNAPISEDKKHPIILPRNSTLTQLIIQNEHLKTLHGGLQLLISTLQSQYWIIRIRDAVKFLLRKCVQCTKLKATTMTQMMASLPSFRVTPSRAFSRCGVDLAGPFLTRPLSSKITRAIHLELVSSLSTEAFIAALRRFIARRGNPSDIYSDNGTNFVGADRELKTLIKQTEHNESIANNLSSSGIHWHFNPPSAPHFGGLWEAGVKSVKFHLRHVIGSHRLNYEELSTIITQIEAILNSRPITPESSDPNDLAALTPGHFLIGSSLISPPIPNLTHLKLNRLSRWQLLQQIQQSFWRRWSSEYITRLQQRPKWMSTKQQIKLNDLVIIKDDNLPPMEWRLGRIIQLHPGQDNLTRVVTIKTATGILKRPIVKLCLLPIDNNE